jgi:aspartate racemase
LAEKVAALGAEAFIAGCTEIPLLLKYITSPVPFYDRTLILAKEVISFGYSDQLSKCN